MFAITQKLKKCKKCIKKIVKIDSNEHKLKLKSLKNLL